MVDDYETYEMTWRKQRLIIRWCADSFVYVGIGHLEIRSEDSGPHPISETGCSHFCPKAEVEDMGGPVAFVTAWLETKDDGKPVQLSIWICKTSHSGYSGQYYP